jgi:hypothetical protein
MPCRAANELAPVRFPGLEGNPRPRWFVALWTGAPVRGQCCRMSRGGSDLVSIVTQPPHVHIAVTGSAMTSPCRAAPTPAGGWRR